MKEIAEVINRSIKLAIHNYFYRIEVEKEKLLEAEETIEQAQKAIEILRETLVKLYDGNRSNS